jgi:hypothetical protein
MQLTLTDIRALADYGKYPIHPLVEKSDINFEILTRSFIQGLEWLSEELTDEMNAECLARYDIHKKIIEDFLAAPPEITPEFLKFSRQPWPIKNIQFQGSGLYHGMTPFINGGKQPSLVLANHLTPKNREVLGKMADAGYNVERLSHPIQPFRIQNEWYTKEGRLFSTLPGRCFMYAYSNEFLKRF